MIVDEFIVRGEKEATLDWFLRANASLAVTPDVKPAGETPLSPPYEYLKDLKTADTNGQWSAVWTLKAKKDTPPKRLCLTLKAEPKTQVGSCLAPGGAGLAQHWGTLRIRRKTNSTRFLVVYQLLDSGADEKPVSFVGDTITVGEMTVELPEDPKALPRLR